LENNKGRTFCASLARSLLYVYHSKIYFEPKSETRMENASVLDYIFYSLSLTNRQYRQIFKLGTILIKFYIRRPAKIL